MDNNFSIENEVSEVIDYYCEICKLKFKRPEEKYEHLIGEKHKRNFNMEYDDGVIICNPTGTLRGNVKKKLLKKPKNTIAVVNEDKAVLQNKTKTKQTTIQKKENLADVGNTKAKPLNKLIKKNNINNNNTKKRNSLQTLREETRIKTDNAKNIKKTKLFSDGISVKKKELPKQHLKIKPKITESTLRTKNHKETKETSEDDLGFTIETSKSKSLREIEELMRKNPKQLYFKTLIGNDNSADQIDLLDSPSNAINYNSDDGNETSLFEKNAVRFTINTTNKKPGNGPFICAACNRSFTQSRQYREHELGKKHLRKQQIYDNMLELIHSERKKSSLIINRPFLNKLNEARNKL